MLSFLHINIARSPFTFSNRRRLAKVNGKHGCIVRTRRPLLNPESRVASLESGARSQGSGPQSQGSGARSQGPGVRSQESGVQESKLRSQEHGVRIQESGVRSQKSGVRSKEPKVRSPGREPRVRSPGREPRVRSPGSGAQSQEPGFRSPGLKARVLGLAFCRRRTVLHMLHLEPRRAHMPRPDSRSLGRAITTRSNERMPIYGGSMKCAKASWVIVV